jgi:hypothetical protein
MSNEAIEADGAMATLDAIYGDDDKDEQDDQQEEQDTTTYDLIEAVKHNKDGDKDVTDKIDIDRWSKYGKDRIYMNGLKCGDGWISLNSDDNGGERWTKVSAKKSIDGDIMTITIGKHKRGRRNSYTIKIRINK